MIRLIRKFLLWVESLHDAHNRRFDLQVLWPIILEQARDRDAAKAAFYWHVTNDPTWSDHYSSQQLAAIVEAL
jgi:hypothetical protein